jgi:hypothetical protein
MRDGLEIVTSVYWNLAIRIKVTALDQVSRLDLLSPHLSLFFDVDDDVTNDASALL